MTARKAVPPMVMYLVIDPPYSVPISPYRVFGEGAGITAE